MKHRLEIVISIGCVLSIIASFSFLNQSALIHSGETTQSNNEMPNGNYIVLTGCTTDSDGTGRTDVFCPNHDVFHLSRDPPIAESKWTDVQLTIDNGQYTIQYTTPIGTNQYTLVAYNTSTPIKKIFSSPSYAVQQISQSVESEKQSIGNIFEQATQTFNAKPPPTKEELYQYALQVINQDRKAHRLNPVALSNISSAQNHADDMLNSGYFSHWNTDGVKPYVTYTKLGGRGNVDENISVTAAYCPSSSCMPNSFDPFKQINDSEYNMMYKDAGSYWGHRDNILNPYHTDVNIGIAYSNERFYFVEHFESNIVKWQTIKLEGNQLHLVGQMPSGYSLYQIEVFADPSPKSLTNNDLNGASPYNFGYYDQGDFVGIILPQPDSNSHYPECSQGKAILETTKGKLCTDYVTYSNVSTIGNGIDISFDVSKWMGSGLHTVYVTLKDQNGIQADTTSLTLEYLK
ncbi:MAG TPA: CAP domain-containing protein [Nitrosopumilaceae archaeon]|nr:CAP domain-containing protein [Nitrosopumilaceae archaeon]